MNTIRQYFDNIHPSNHLRLRGGFYLNTEVEINGTGVLAIKWGNLRGLHLLEIVLDTESHALSYRYGCASTNWTVEG
jgi:hypothetical protein